MTGVAGSGYPAQITELVLSPGPGPGYFGPVSVSVSVSGQHQRRANIEIENMTERERETRWSYQAAGQGSLRGRGPFLSAQLVCLPACLPANIVNAV